MTYVRVFCLIALRAQIRTARWLVELLLLSSLYDGSNGQTVQQYLSN